MDNLSEYMSYRNLMLDEYKSAYTSTEPMDTRRFNEGYAGLIHTSPNLSALQGSKVTFVNSPGEARKLTDNSRHTSYFSTPDTTVSLNMSITIKHSLYSIGTIARGLGMGVSQMMAISNAVDRSMPSPLGVLNSTLRVWYETDRVPGDMLMPGLLRPFPCQQLCPVIYMNLVILDTIRATPSPTLDYITGMATSMGSMYISGYRTIAVDRPSSLLIDSRGRPHCTTGPAITYRDGDAYYMVHGLSVNKEWIEDPDSINTDTILYQRNVEVRRALIEIYGMERYVNNMFKNGPVHRDRYGELYKRSQPGDEDIAIVKVINPTPEPDGTYKAYFLRVNPRVRTAHEAVASTFRYKGVPLTPEQYNPLQES